MPPIVVRPVTFTICRMTDTAAPLLPFVLDPAADAQARAAILELDARASRVTAVVEGCEVAFRCFGEGPPLVLLHGGHGSWLHWIRNIDALSASHRLWVADMPGYGDSGVPAGEQTLDLIVSVLDAALDQVLGAGQPCDIVGFSFGGLCAATLAARRPPVRRVALLGSAGHGQDRRQRLGMLNWKGLASDAERDARLHHNLAALMLHDESKIDALALALHRDSCINTRYRSKNLSRRPMLPVQLDALAERGVPVLLVWGEHDVTASPATAAATLLHGVASRELAIVPNVGHWVQYEAAGQINPMLLAWLA